MKEKSASYLRKRRKILLERLPPLEKVLRGSLIERYKKCGKPGCKCAEGQGHGPKYYLSVSRYRARPEMDYVPQDYQRQVEEYLANFKKMKELVEEICLINRELLRRRERL